MINELLPLEAETIQPPPISTDLAGQLWLQLHKSRQVTLAVLLEPDEEKLYQLLTRRLIADASIGFIKISQAPAET